MKKHIVSLTLFVLSLVTLVASLYMPFFTVQLETTPPESVLVGKGLIEKGLSLSSGGFEFVGMDNPLKGAVNGFFGPTLFSEGCRADWTPCFQDWLAAQIGITRGEQYMIQMIRSMFEHGELFLGTLIVTFSVIFPLIKVVMGMVASLTSVVETQQYLYIWLTKISKWSMTDVFVVSLLILFFKADNIDLYMEAKSGVYLFAVHALLSSIGTYVLSRELGANVTFGTGE